MAPKEKTSLRLLKHVPILVISMTLLAVYVLGQLFKE
jgi:hypothetical protein